MEEDSAVILNQDSAVSLNQYWAYIGMPYFFSVLAFCLFVLFRISGSALSSEREILQFMKSLKETRSPHARNAAGRNAAPAATPSFSRRPSANGSPSAFTPPSK